MSVDHQSTSQNNLNSIISLQKGKSIVEDNRAKNSQTLIPANTNADKSSSKQSTTF